MYNIICTTTVVLNTVVTQESKPLTLSIVDMNYALEVVLLKGLHVVYCVYLIEFTNPRNALND